MSVAAGTGPPSCSHTNTAQPHPATQEAAIRLRWRPEAGKFRLLPADLSGVTVTWRD